METTKYLLTLSAGAAIGMGLGASDLLTAQAKPMDYQADVCIDLGAGAITTLESFIGAQLCPQVDADFVLSPGTCSPSALKSHSPGVRLIPQDEDSDGIKEAWRMCSSVTLPGQFVAD